MEGLSFLQPWVQLQTPPDDHIAALTLVPPLPVR
jgi:hypothetical protein